MEPSKSSIFKLVLLCKMNSGQTLLIISTAGKPISLPICAIKIGKLVRVNSTNYLPLASSSDGEVSFIN